MRNKLFISSCFAVERRRRDKINAWIETLAKLIPDCSDDIKLNEVCQHVVITKVVVVLYFSILERYVKRNFYLAMA